MTAEQTEALMRTWAAGSYPDEAGVELLIRSGLSARVDLSDAWRDDRFDVDALERAFASLSGGERRIVAIALSLLSGEGRAVDLPYVITSLDRRSLNLVLAAIAHAAGSHQHREMVDDEQGSTESLGYLPAAHPWPHPDQDPTA